MRIYGNTVGTTLPKPNLDQTDPKKGDYIKGDRSFTKGDPGAVYVPNVDEAGNLSWSNDGGLKNPATVNIMGADGYTPVKGKDYCTDADKEEMVEAVLGDVPRAAHIAVERQTDTTTMTLTMKDGSTCAVVIAYDGSGDPASVTVDGEEVTLEFLYSRIYLFQQGDNCEAVTGGWVSNAKVTGDVTELRKPALDCSGGNMAISLTTDKNSASGSVVTVDAIDLGQYSRLVFDVASVSGSDSIRLGVMDTDESKYSFLVEAAPAVGLNELDLTAVSGSHKVAVCVKAAAGVTTSLALGSIYLE